MPRQQTLPWSSSAITLTFFAIAGPLSPIATASPATVIPGDGTYRVGIDILPGTYISKGGQNGDDCIWFRHKTMGASAYDIIDAGASPGQQVVTIAATDATFETINCKNWSLAESNPPTRVENRPTATPADLPGLQHASLGESCSNTTNFIFALAPDGGTLACLPSTPSPKYVGSAPLVGVRSIGADCSEPSRLAQSPDGQPVMCMTIGNRDQWVVFRDN